MFHTRTQIDEKGDTASRQTGLDCSDSKDMARQEFGAEADINTILGKFGVNTQNRPPQYGELDTNLDLQQALAAIAESRAAYKRLAPEIRKEYNTWQKFVNGMNDGTLVALLDKMGKQHAADEAAAKAPKPEEKPN